MGTGKTTVGLEIARIVDCTFFDLDHEISHYTNQSIPEIFDIEGEVYFRQVESEVLGTLLHEKNDSFVIASGGGAVLSKENRQLMRKRSFVVHLRATREEIIRRLQAEQESRPLIKGNLAEKVDQLLEQRNKLYDFADFTIQTDQLSVDEVADKIVREWENYRNA